MRARLLRKLWPLYLLVAACSSDDGSGTLPYTRGKITVIGSSDEDAGERAAKEQCGDGASAEVLAGSDGQVLQVVCYPHEGHEVVKLADAAEDPELGDDVVAVLDGSDDGDDVEGDLLITSNRVIVFGSGPDVSVIGGDLEVAKNDAIVHGVRVRGDVVLDKDDAALTDCVIEGDLLVTGNNNGLASCQVWGKVMIDGNDTVLVSNLIAGDQAIRGVDLRCNDNHRFTDVEGDGEIEESDVLAPVNCLPPL